MKRSRPGRRFQDRYEHARRETKECGPGQRILLVLLAVVFLAIAVVLSVFPGPAIPFFFLAGALLAAESRTIARFMDWAEVLIRRVLAWAKRIWRKLPVVARVLVVLVGISCSAGMAFLSWRLMRG